MIERIAEIFDIYFLFPSFCCLEFMCHTPKTKCRRCSVCMASAITFDTTHKRLRFLVSYLLFDDVLNMCEHLSSILLVISSDFPHRVCLHIHIFSPPERLSTEGIPYHSLFWHLLVANNRYAFIYRSWESGRQTRVCQNYPKLKFLHRTTRPVADLVGCWCVVDVYGLMGHA